MAELKTKSSKITFKSWLKKNNIEVSKRTYYWVADDGRASVYNTLKISELPQGIKDRIAENVISAGTVVSITRELKNPDEQVKAVEAAIVNAQKTAEATGKKVKTATAKDVNGSANKPVMARIEELIAKLDDNDVKNTRVTLLKALHDGLKNKKKLNQLYELFR